MRKTQEESPECLIVEARNKPKKELIRFENELENIQCELDDKMREMETRIIVKQLRMHIW